MSVANEPVSHEVSLVYWLKEADVIPNPAKMTTYTHPHSQ